MTAKTAKEGFVTGNLIVFVATGNKTLMGIITPTGGRKFTFNENLEELSHLIVPTEFIPRKQRGLEWGNKCAIFVSIVARTHNLGIKRVPNSKLTDLQNLSVKEGFSRQLVNFLVFRLI